MDKIALDLIVDSFSLGLNALDNTRENEIRLQLYESYKQGRIYRCGEFDHICFNIHVTYCGTSVRLLAEKTKSSKKERRLTIWTLNWNWNLNWYWSANCNTSDQGVISHSRAIKKTNLCILMKLKATISIIVRVIGKNDVLHGEFLLSCPALLLIRLLRVSLKLQSDFIENRNSLFKKTVILLSRPPWQVNFLGYQTFLNFFLNNYLTWLLFFSEKPKW